MIEIPPPKPNREGEKTVYTTILDQRKKGTVKPGPLVPPRVSIPAEPIYDKVAERVLYEEQQVTRVSVLMSKGIREPSHLCRLLELDRKEIARYVPRVIARWEQAGSRIDHNRSRGEALQRLDLIEGALWEQIEYGSPRIIDGVVTGTADTRANIAALKTLLDVSAHRSDIQGLTAKVIERLGLTTDETLEFTKSAAAHDKMAGLASRMLDMLDRRMPADEPAMKTIEATANADISTTSAARPRPARRRP